MAAETNGYAGRWIGDPVHLIQGEQAVTEAIARIRRPVYVVKKDGTMAATHLGAVVYGKSLPLSCPEGLPLMGFVPGIGPEDLGDAAFKTDHGLRYAYIVGAMANGISSVEMLQAAGNAGMVGFFGAGGLSLNRIEAAIQALQSSRKPSIFGFNLIHSPNDQGLESSLVDLYLRHGISLISASAFLGITPALVRYRVNGIAQTPNGRIVCPNRVIAKVSREEIARRFFAPPPDAILSDLVKQGHISRDEALLARHIPLAQDLTAEADSGGHTDNRPAFSLLPTMRAIRDQAMEKYHFSSSLRVGLAGGIATPEATAAAFAMGASYVLSGSINQACREAATSQAVRGLLAQTQQADVVMAPAADMFELGVKVQVLKRGTMFAMRASKLYDLYRQYNQYEDIPAQERSWIEKDLLQSSFAACWDQTCRFFQMRNPDQIKRAEKDPKYRMALVFRSYLGQASHWAISGAPDRQIDYQVWCGPAMGAFNAWAKGSFLENWENRHVALLALNLLYGACGIIRRQGLSYQGVPVEKNNPGFYPLTMAELEQLMEG